MKYIIMFKYLFAFIVLVLLDIGIFILFGLALMSYDDFYDETKGAYWSLESMTLSEQLIYIGFNVWLGINVLVLFILTYKIAKYWLCK